MLRHLEVAFLAIESAERQLAERHGLSSGEIHIGASDTLCHHYLLPYLERFRREYPGIRISVTNRTSPETVKLLKEGRIDFGIISLPASDPAIDVRDSMQLHDCLVAGRAFSDLEGRLFYWPNCAITRSCCLSRAGRRGNISMPMRMRTERLYSLNLSWAVSIFWRRLRRAVLDSLL
ncbi:LysR substrate binding domain-containing protein [Cohnella sp. OV330]|nr:LysR substrate binding domain-containing protein [Cohnella sp. OV330]